MSPKLEDTVESLWIPTTTNRKTGNIPTSYIGRTLEDVRRSCEAADCKLLENKQCYAWFGTPRAAYASLEKADERGKDHSLRTAIKQAVRSARFLRVGALGDPCLLPPDELAETYDTARSEGFRGVLAYTHGWKEAGQHLCGLAMASCDSLEEADEALDEGWRTTAILPWDSAHDGNITPAGRNVAVCAAQIKRGVNCNTCGLCDAQARGPPIIGFLDHGPQARAARRRTTKPT